MPYFPPAPAPTAPAGNTQEIQFNGGGVFASDPNFIWDGSQGLQLIGAIYGSAGLNGPAIDFINGIIYDASLYPTIDFNTRTLSDTGGVQVASWETRTLQDFSVAASLDWANRILYDSALNIVLNWDSGVMRPNEFTINGKIIDPPVLVVKTADESVTSSTALQNDDELTFAINSGETWEFEVMAFVSAGALGGIKATVNGPASPTNVVYLTEIMKAGLAIVAGIQSAYGTTQTDVGGTLYAVRIAGTVINGGNSGAVVLQWAQNTSNATPTKVLKGSYIKARRVA